MKNKGITLISLIVTIIVLLILAGISITTITSDNGIFNKASSAKSETSKANAEEKVKLIIGKLILNKNGNAKLIDLNELVDSNSENYSNEIGMDNVIKAMDESAIIKIDGYAFTIDNKLNIINIEENNSVTIPKENIAVIEPFEKQYVIQQIAQVTTQDKKIGNGSVYLNSTSIINTQDSGKTGFNSDFTVDYWIKESNEDLAQTWTPHFIVSNTGGLWLGLHNGKYVVRGYSVTDYITINPPTVGSWTHVAVCRKSGIIYVFYNGIVQNTTSNSVSFPSGNLYIGTDGGGNYAKFAYMDELRILNNEAIWTSDFTVPNEEYTDKYSMLYHFDATNIIENNITLNKIEFKLGMASAYLNNSYMKYNISDMYNFASDFTADYWIKESNEDISQTWSPHLIFSNTGGLWLGLHNGKFVVRGYSVEDYISINPPSVGQWTHIAVCRKSGVIYVFYNGILQTKVQNTISFPKGYLYIGTDGGGNYAKNVYMDELRIVNGVAAWTTDFSVPNTEY